MGSPTHDAFQNTLLIVAAPGCSNVTDYGTLFAFVITELCRDGCFGHELLFCSSKDCAYQPIMYNISKSIAPAVFFFYDCGVFFNDWYRLTHENRLTYVISISAVGPSFEIALKGTFFFGTRRAS